MGPNDVQVIAPWMTFDYINYIFGLPKVYLSSTLGITDVYYPHIPLIRYARESNVPIETLVLEAQDAVTAYFLTVSK